ncbi:hypothetical protein ROM51_22490, partial [Cronobacter sakazakii]|uniref:hypothetical protein n=1 Tax=Cronobacter sakazakii TaxID=28141 RepID=UPI0028959C27
MKTVSTEPISSAWTPPAKAKSRTDAIKALHFILLPSLKIDRSDYSSFYRKSIKYQVFTKNVRWRGPDKHIQLKKTRNAKRTKNA